jgi:hypothetical protein
MKRRNGTKKQMRAAQAAIMGIMNKALHNPEELFIQINFGYAWPLINK